MSTKKYTFIYLGIAIATGVFIGRYLNFDKKPNLFVTPNNKPKEKLERLINYIQYDYVENIDTDSLLDKTITQLLSNLDPHSYYIPETAAQSVQETMEGHFKGIGIKFRMIKDTLTVLEVLKGGPSEKAGLQVGDRILKIEKDTVFGKKTPLDSIINLIRGQQSKPISLHVFRKTNQKYLDFTFNRDDVKLISVPVGFMLTSKVGYIKIALFAKSTYQEFHRVLLSLKKQGMQTLIVDLRGNTGGFLEIANDIIDEFLPNQSLMVYTKSKSGKITESRATLKGDFEDGNIYVLINEESASASEILAGAIQDNDRGTIVGRRSFGKGLVQQEMHLGDGSFVRLTTARYYTPAGRCIQRPYDHNGNKNYYKDTNERVHNGELFYKDSMPIIDSLKYTTSKGKIVYGGGGIIPDIFIPLDTTMSLSYINLLRLREFAFNYTDNHRGQLIDYNFNDFDQNFDIEKCFQEYAKTHNKPQNVPYFKIYLKALVARELFYEEGFIKINKEHDKMLQKVLELEQQDQ